MAYEFVRRADGLVMCRLDPQEKAVVAQVAQEVADLIRADLRIGEEPEPLRDAARSEDPLMRLEAEFAASAPRTPSDSAVQRLFPDASEDPHLAAEFRRLSQQDLAEAKLRALGIVQRTIDAAGAIRTEIVLDAEAEQAWMRALNDMRLVLADRLSLREDEDIETLRLLQQIGERVEDADALFDAQDQAAGVDGDAADETGPDAGSSHAAAPDLVLAVYELLTWLQDSLVGVQERPAPREPRRPL